MALLEQDVLGLDVAVDHALAVGVIEGVGHLAREPERPRRLERSLPVEQVAERALVDAGHDVVQQAAGVAGIEQRQQVGMLEPRRDPDLPQEALGAELRAEAGLQHLEGDGAVVAEVAGAVDHRHAAVAELPLDRVAGFEGGLQALQQIEHGPAGKAVPLEYRPPGRRQGQPGVA